jgi:hypothetical protein
MKVDRYFLTLSSGWRHIRLMKVKTDIFLPCHMSYGWRTIRLVKVDRCFPTLSSGWGPSRPMKVETDIFLPCHLVGDLLDL